MPARAPVHGTSRFLTVSLILASLTLTSTMAAMTSVPAVTEQVYRDKGDEDHHPEPVCCEPFHDALSFPYAVLPATMDSL